MKKRGRDETVPAAAEDEVKERAASRQPARRVAGGQRRPHARKRDRGAHTTPAQHHATNAAHEVARGSSNDLAEMVYPALKAILVTEGGYLFTNTGQVDHALSVELVDAERKNDAEGANVQLVDIFKPHGTQQLQREIRVLPDEQASREQFLTGILAEFARKNPDAGCFVGRNELRPVGVRGTGCAALPFTLANFRRSVKESKDGRVTIGVPQRRK